MIPETGDVIGEVGVAVPAVFEAVAVFDFAAIVGGLEEVFHQVDGVVEVEVVHVAAVDMELALKLWA